MELPTLKVERLYRQISNLLIGYINGGQFLPGQMIPSERDLAKQLGVSRSSIREALIALEITGWVEIRTGNGVYVSNPLPSQHSGAVEEEFSLQSLIKARQIYECTTAELAALNGTDDQREKLAEINRELTQLSINNRVFLAEDKRFHLQISEMTGNEVLRDMMEYLWNKRESARFVRLESHYAETDFPLQMNADHQAITDAILARDPVGAKKAMQSHLQHVYDRLFNE
ncbi:GntR family transcriptional regulator [Rouxiella silvae]|jgi:GntR family uxuAB operon transcriptional repressor|uniref:FadR family transcriptional regulator n=1 Tax=Rouxiella silvae TaxID=1646373 RepID=A0AA40X4K4_9GAMM|nr:FadR/GntR family transcriptional regulator [Rouxiella silvae]KQN46325.1 GntR family transcriptional regulator [Serratia sp. Leaf50]MBF6638224.1 FadR family transcriptional regulator [Rouxiella silvae]ORJ21761.1 GntR family transcriptional regulator [Rouxiella silvae]